MDIPHCSDCGRRVQECVSGWSHTDWHGDIQPQRLVGFATVLKDLKRWYDNSKLPSWPITGPPTEVFEEALTLLGHLADKLWDENLFMELLFGIQSVEILFKFFSAPNKLLIKFDHNGDVSIEASNGSQLDTYSPFHEQVYRILQELYQITPRKYVKVTYPSISHTGADVLEFSDLDNLYSMLNGIGVGDKLQLEVVEMAPVDYEALGDSTGP